jgi:hypothetical protein
MSALRLESQWIALAVAVAVVGVASLFGLRIYRRRARRRSLLLRLERIALRVAHQVEVPDGMGGYFHVDHLLLTLQGLLVLDTRRVQGLIFGGDQMSEWTVMARNRRYTFENPQPALYDRVAAVKALAGEVPVEGRLLFSDVGRFTKGRPKWVLMLDSLEVEFPPVDRAAAAVTVPEGFLPAWERLTAQLRPSPHAFTSL